MLKQVEKVHKLSKEKRKSKKR